MASVRYTRRYQRIVANLKAARLQPCMRCGQRIDYGASIGEPDAFNAGHILSWSEHPEAREDPANFRQEHEDCNKSAGKRPDKPTLGVVSADW